EAMAAGVEADLAPIQPVRSERRGVRAVTHSNRPVVERRGLDLLYELALPRDPQVAPGPRGHEEFVERLSCGDLGEALRRFAGIARDRGPGRGVLGEDVGC